MNPQCEDGYTKIANEILDALCRFRIPGEQRQCLDFILRKTYGYHKKEDSISNSQFCEGTGLLKGNVTRALKELSEKQLVIKNDNGKYPTYRFNKNYTEWRELSKKQPVIKKATVVIKSDNRLLSKVMDTKDNITKENITKDIKRFMSPSLQEVKEYCLERENGIDAERFINFYESKGWMIGKNKMKCWKSAVRTWEKNNHTKQNQPRPMTVSESLIVQREKIAEALYNDPDDPFNSPARRAQIRANQLSGNKDDGKPVENAGGGLVRGPEK